MCVDIVVPRMYTMAPKSASMNIQEGIGYSAILRMDIGLLIFLLWWPC